MTAPRAPQNSPAHSISLSPSSHFEDTKLCSPAVGLARHPPKAFSPPERSSLGWPGERGRWLSPDPSGWAASGLLPPQNPHVLLSTPSAQKFWERLVLPSPPLPTYKFLCAGPASPGTGTSGRWSGWLLEVLNKVHRWPPSELPLASAGRAVPPPLPAPGHGAGCCLASPSQALLPPKTQPSPRLRDAWKQGAPGSRHLSLQAMTCDSPPCTPIPGAPDQ